MPGAATAGSGVGMLELRGFEGDCERPILPFGRGGMIGMSLPNVLPEPLSAGTGAVAGAGLRAFVLSGRGGIGGRSDMI